MPKQSILPKHAPHRDQFSFHKVCTQCSTAREARTWSQLTTRNDRSKRQTLVHASSPNSSSPFPRGTAATTLDGSYSSVLPAVSVGRRRPSEHAGCPGRKPHGSPHGERRRCLTGSRQGRAPTAAAYGGGAGHRTQGPLGPPLTAQAGRGTRQAGRPGPRPCMARGTPARPGRRPRRS